MRHLLSLPLALLTLVVGLTLTPATSAQTPVLREDLREVPAHIPAVPDDLTCAFLGLELLGPGKDRVKLSFHPNVANDPHYLWNGECEGPVLIGFPFAKTLDLSGQDGLVRLRSKNRGKSTLHLAVRIGEVWFAQERGVAADADWTVHEVALQDARWRRLEADNAEMGPRVDRVPLAAVDALGFFAPRRAQRSKDCIRLDWFELVSTSARLEPEPVADDIDRPNVLVLLLDDAGYHDFGFMGSEQMPTPNIDALAASGMRFADAHLSGTTCSPSRAGIMTGRYQQRFGHHNNVPPHGHGMDPSERTVGDAFRDGGYKTYYVGKWHLGAVEQYLPNNRGFDEFWGLLEGSRSYWPNDKQDRPDNDRAIRHNDEPVAWDGYLTDRFTDAAIGYLQEERDRPFFMLLSYTAPHTPMHAREEHLKKFEGHPRKKLAAMLWAADLGIGRVLAQLEALDLRENTLVVFLSDNGGAQSNGSNNAPLKGFKGTKFEGGQRTPFVLSWPAKIPAGSTFDGLVSALDIYPTTAAACGVDSTRGKRLDGVNFLPWVLGQREGDPHEALYWQRSDEHAVRVGDHKLIGHERHGFRLYDLTQDLGETRDLSRDQPERKTRMLATLKAWERDLAEPQWKEGAAWNAVKVEAYRAWLNNEEPRFIYPGQRKRVLEQDRRAAAQGPEPRLVEVGMGWAKNSVNATVFRHDSITSFEDEQFVAFYDAEGRVVLGKRKLGTTEWTTKVTPYSGNVRDAHNGISIMVDGDGYLHVAWDHHGHPLRYCKSTKSGSLELTEKRPMFGDHEDRVTYPEFYRYPNGDLLFLYRDGSSGNGNLVANRYLTAARRWVRLHDNLLDGEGQRNAYWQCCIDDRGTVHLSWVWRESGDASSNHDLGYARSLDGGRAWQRTDGSRYELPITATTSEYALRIPQRSSLINTTTMTADGYGNPFLASWWAPEGTGIPQYHLVWHDGKAWHERQITTRKEPYDLGGNGTRAIPLARPRLLFARDGPRDRLFMLFRDAERGSRVSLARCDDLTAGRWLIRDLTEESVGAWEPSFDTELWRTRRELHVFVQNMGQGAGERTVDLPPQPVRVLEWKPGG